MRHRPRSGAVADGESRLSSLRVRLLIVQALPILVVTVLLGYLAYAEREQRIADALVHLQHTAAAIAAQQSDAVQHAKADIEEIIENADIRRFKANPQRCSRMLGLELKGHPHLADLLVADATGKVHCSGLKTSKPISLAGRQDFRHALNSTDFVTGGPLTSRPPAGTVIPIAKAMRKRDGSVHGVAVAAVSVAWLSTRLALSSAPKDADLALVDGRGNSLARHPPPAAGRGASDASLLQPIAVKGGYGISEHVGADGVERIHVLTRITDTEAGPIDFRFTLAKSRVTREIDRHILVVLVLLLGAGLAACIVGWVLYERWLLRPVAALVGTARRIEQGDFLARTGLPGDRSEVGRLVRAFDRMAECVACANEDAKLAKEAAEAANRAKSIFLANMSHEIRTPLHVIIGLAHLMQRDLADAPERQRMVQLCATSEHLLALVNDVLDLSKIEAERLVLDVHDFRLETVLNRVLQVIDEAARAKNLRLMVEASPEVRVLPLRGDALRLAQVLINLCSNAVKFTDRGSVRLAIAAVAQDAARVRLQFTVEDTGIGIAPDVQARLFQAFVQADGTTTRGYGGTGLGLAISRRLVALMGGTIHVESSVGSGSRFSFEFDALRGSAAAPEPVAASVEELSGRHLLLVDDHPLSQDIVFEMLDDLGCTVDVAADGTEAVACAKAKSYDLILMDMQMPRLDGLAATRLIRALPEHRTTPIVALTANAYAEDRQRCLDAGMNGHIAKPITPAQLAGALGQWLGGITAPAADAAAVECALGRALAAIPGLEIPFAMRRSSKDLADCQDLLQRLVRMHGDDMQRVREHLAENRPDAAHAVAHKLKGIAGLVGARRIAALAQDIVHELRRGADAAEIDALAAKCAAELAQLGDAVTALPMPDAGEAAAELRAAG